MLKRHALRTSVFALGVALAGLLVVSPATGFLTAFLGSVDGLPSMSPPAGTGGSALAQIVPGPLGRAYVANEGTGTISVIDTMTNVILSTICLGSDPAIPGTPQPGGPCNAENQHHNPLYNGHVGTHGLWLTPDGRVLLATNRISGTVVAIDTLNNTVLGYQPVGREPHLATVRPGGREAWVAVRGEEYIDVLELERERLFRPNLLDTQRMESEAFVRTSPGPSMVSFTPDGRFAFVVSAKQGLVHKIDAYSRQIVTTSAVPFAFSPFGLVTPDGGELFLIHKLGAGPGVPGPQGAFLTVLRTSDLSSVVSAMPLNGDCGNHVAFVGRLAYITLGGPRPCAPAGAATRQGKIVIVDRSTHQPVRELAGPDLTGDPHGIWATPNGRRLFVGRESASQVTIIDTGTNPNDPADDTIVGTIADPTFMKQPIDVVIGPVPGARQREYD